MDNIIQSFTGLLHGKGIVVTERQLAQFESYYTNLVEWNEKMNLTGITQRDQVYIKHFYDSLSLGFFVPMAKIVTLADIGSGAGFPSIPLKIVFPHLRVTIIDSLNKRIQFLKHLTEVLELDDVQCVHGRAEDVARKTEYRDRHDAVTARAVAKLAVLNELCLPFVKPGGLFAAMKGTKPDSEIEEAQFCAKQLKAELQAVHSLELPQENSERHIVIYRKISATPGKYPRKAGVPAKTPLIK